VGGCNLVCHVICVCSEFVYSYSTVVAFHGLLTYILQIMDSLHPMLLAPRLASPKSANK
jgi:hypothetical protein